ncbi:MAG TPA: HAMP domain-containing sensor histidine kinase [Actinomycetota bacterium]|jgi:signal transduction histidine kinase
MGQAFAFRQDPLVPDILREMAHAFGSATDLDEATRSTVRWLTEAAGPPATARLFVPEPGARFRLAAAQGLWADVGRKHSARRREAFGSMQPVLVNVRRPPAHALAILPLVARGASMGVAEVIAPRSALSDRWDLLEAVASQAAGLLSHIRRQAALRNRVEALEHAAGFARRLVGAGSRELAVREAVSFCHERFRVPVAGWLDGDGPVLRLTAVKGIGAVRAGHLEREVPTIGRWSSLDHTARSLVEKRTAGLLRSERVAVIDAGDAVLILGGVRETAGLAPLGSLLEEALEHIAIVDLARQRNEALDMGVALTAHEVRGPLLGAKAVMERLIGATEVTPGHLEQLELSRRELQELSGLVEALLSWSVGSGSLDPRPVDLAQVIREAVEACGLQAGARTVRVQAPHAISIQADRRHLKAAVANVVRNALAYSPTSVDVSVERRNGSVTVAVSDRGPGIPPEDRQAIFDPFVRGRANGPRPGRTGLGLFVARRVVEAHKGEIWVEPSGRGSVFKIRLPVGQGR